MTAYAREQLAPGMTALDAVRAVGLALHRDMRFDPEATTVDTPPPRPSPAATASARTSPR